MGITRAYAKFFRIWILPVLMVVIPIFTLSSFINHSPGSASSSSSLLNTSDRDIQLQPEYQYQKKDTNSALEDAPGENTDQFPYVAYKHRKEHGNIKEHSQSHIMLTSADKKAQFHSEHKVNRQPLIKGDFQINSDYKYNRETANQPYIRKYQFVSGRSWRDQQDSNKPVLQSDHLRHKNLDIVIKKNQARGSFLDKYSIKLAQDNNTSVLFSPSDRYKYRYEDIINTERKTRIIWKTGDCQKYKVYFAKKETLPTCALASYPGSGNTWTRRLVEYGSGIFTGSIYSDMQLYSNGYYGELDKWQAGTTIAQKTHDCGPAHIESFNRSAILLIRNPYRAILSFHNYLFGGHTGFAPMSNYRRKDWGTFVHLQAKSWLEMAINWTTMANPKSLTVIHYENLQEDPIPELNRVLQGRGFIPDIKRLECLKREQTSKAFKRLHEYIPENLEIFSARDRDKIDRAIRYVDYLLRKKGQQPLPIHLYEFYNGTASTHILELPCKDEETQAQCDSRVDTLNQSRKKKVKHKEGGDAQENISNSRKSRKTLEIIQKIPAKGQELLTNMFERFLLKFRKDPISSMLQQDNSFSLQRRNLQLDTDYQEAETLIRDFQNRHSKGDKLIL